jgi:bifunctional non-homologous end joining protein LigD
MQGGRNRLVGGFRHIAAQGPRQDQGWETSATQTLPAGAEQRGVAAEARRACAVEYRDWTRDGLIRNASFKGLRDDKPAQEIALEAPQKRSKARADSAASGVKLTHPERILWAEQGITKQGLADFTPTR